MMQRLRDALRRSVPLNRLIASIDRTSCVWTPSGQTDCVAMHCVQAAASQPGRSLEELQVRRPHESPARAPATQSRSAVRQIAALKTRSDLRQAWLLKRFSTHRWRCAIRTTTTTLDSTASRGRIGFIRPLAGSYFATGSTTWRADRWREW